MTKRTLGPSTLTSLVAIVLPLSCSGCGSSATQVSNTDVVASVTVSPSSITLQPGDTMRLQASAFAMDGGAINGLPVAWSSNGPGVATVSSAGLVTGVAAGSTRIDATIGAVTAGATVTVSGTTTPRTVFFTESFESANATARGWFDGSSGNWTLSTAEKHSGASSLEWRWTSGSVLPAFGGTSRRMFTQSPSVHISYWAKYSSNWVGSGQPYHPHEFYLLTNLDSEWIGPSRTHLTAYIEHNYQAGLRPAVGVQDALNINESAGIPSNLTIENRAVAGCNGNSDGYLTDCYGSPGSYNNSKFWYAPVYLGNTVGTRYKNDWHFIEVYFELNSIVNGVGQKNGIVRYWVDGNLLIDINDALLRTGASPTMAFRTFLLGPYIGPGSPVTQTVWIDDLTVADRR